MHGLLRVLPIMCLIVSSKGQEVDCMLESLPVQEDFNPIGFQGKWYAISVNQLWLNVPVITNLFSPKNIQMTYKVNSLGEVNVTVCGSFVGPFCDIMTGNAEIEDKTKPQKMNLQFNTFFLPAATPKPYWVVATNYEYAVLYSCFNVLENGTCMKNKEYVWTLNRNRKGHTLTQKAQIDEAIRSVCLDPSNGNFRNIIQDGECDIKAVRHYAGPGLLFVLLTSVIGFVVMIICCTCCLSRSDQHSQTKKMQ